MVAANKPEPDAEEAFAEPAGLLAAMARLEEQNVGLQRQIITLEAALRQSERRAAELTDAKFVTFRTLIDSQGERVKLALGAPGTGLGYMRRSALSACW